MCWRVHESSSLPFLITNPATGCGMRNNLERLVDMPMRTRCSVLSSRDGSALSTHRGVAGVGCLAVALALFSSTATGAADWPMERADPRRSASTSEELPLELSLAWTLQLPAPDPAWPDAPRLDFDVGPSPVVVAGRLFVASPREDRLRAFDLRDGAALWDWQADAPIRFAPALAEGRVHVVSDDGKLHTLDAASGELLASTSGAPRRRWLLGNGRIISAWPARGAPVVAAGKVCFGASIWPFAGAFVHALSATSHEGQWCNDGDASLWLLQPHSSPAFSGLAPQGYLALDGDDLFVPNGRATPACLDARSGKLRWYAPSENGRGESFRVGVLDEAVLSGDRLFDRRNGRKVESRKVDGIETPERFPHHAALGGDRLIGARLTSIPGGQRLTLEAFTIRRVSIEDKPPTPIESLEELGRRLVRERPSSARDRVEARLAWHRGVDIEGAVSTVRPRTIRAGSRLWIAAAGRVFHCPAKAPEKGASDLQVAGRFEGEVFSLLAAGGRLILSTRCGRVHVFAAASDLRTAPVIRSVVAPTARGTSQAGVHRGWILLDGSFDAEEVEGRLAGGARRALVVTSDRGAAVSLRRDLRERGILPNRATVLPAELFAADASLPRFFAREAVRRRGVDGSDSLDSLAEFLQSLRPYGGRATLEGASARLLRETAGGAIEAGARLELGGVSLSVLAATEDDEHRVKTLLVERSGALDGAGEWTHQYGDAANSNVSLDRIAQAPLGPLWFGGPSNAKILPRHGHGPRPLVREGRVFIEGEHVLRALDVYTGELEWEVELDGIGSIYANTRHQPGANSVGSNYVVGAAGLFALHGGECVRIDPVLGTIERRLSTDDAVELPGVSREELGRWTALRLAGDTLLLNAAAVRHPAIDFTERDFRKWTRDGRRRGRRVLSALRGFRLPARQWFETDAEHWLRSANLALGLEGLWSRLSPEVRLLADGLETRSLVERLRQLETDASPDADRVESRRLLNRRLLAECFWVLAFPPPSEGRVGESRTLAGVTSRSLVARDVGRGEWLWHHRARHSIRHNTMAAAEGRVFFIDRLPRLVEERLRRRGRDTTSERTMTCLDLQTGELQWTRSDGIFGTFLSVSLEHDLLVESGRYSRDALADESVDQLAVRQVASGDLLWRRPLRYRGPVLLLGKTILTQGRAYDLMTGERKSVANPLTGEPMPWSFSRTYGCNTAIGSQRLLTFRSASAGFFDLARSSGTGNLGGFRSSCTQNLIIADGVVASPDMTRTCDCSYQNQASIGLVHWPELELWTFNRFERGDRPIERIGINLGAPGDRVDRQGVLWLEHPPRGGPTPRVDIETLPADLEIVRVSAFRVETAASGAEAAELSELRWIGASCLRGVERLRLRLSDEEPEAGVRVRLRLVFVRPNVDSDAASIDVRVGTQNWSSREREAPEEGRERWRPWVLEIAAAEVGRDLVVDLSAERGQVCLAGLAVERLR